MNFFISKGQGEEEGPYTQEVLIQKAKNGDLSPETLVRNNLMKQGKPAKSTAFLKEFYKSDSDSKAPAEDKVAKISKHINRTASAINHPPVNYRTMAFLFDLAILAVPVYALGLFLDPVFPVEMPVEEAQRLANSTTLKWAAYSFIICLTYFTLMVGVYAQTLGQKFFGIMLIYKDGEEVLFARSLVYALGLLLLFPLIPLMVQILLRGPHEYLAQVRVVNVKLGG